MDRYRMLLIFLALGLLSAGVVAGTVGAAGTASIPPALFSMSGVSLLASILLGLRLTPRLEAYSVFSASFAAYCPACLLSALSWSSAVEPAAVGPLRVVAQELLLVGLVLAVVAVRLSNRRLRA